MYHVHTCLAMPKRLRAAVHSARAWLAQVGLWSTVRKRLCSSRANGHCLWQSVSQ